MRTAAIYNFLLESTIIASIAIVLMIPVRKFLRGRLGNRAICFAWLLVAVRLLCPLALPNPIIHEIQSPFNFDQAHIRPIAGQLRVRLDDAIDDMWRGALKNGIRSGKSLNEIQEEAAYQIPFSLSGDLVEGRLAHRVMYVYQAGAAGVVLWFVFSNLRFRRKLRQARIEPISGEMQALYQRLCAEMKMRPLPVYLADPLPGACLVGVIRPWIALPVAASPDQAEQMLRHEMWHQKARDPVWTVLQLLCCAVHWFNPLVWLAAYWSRMDREMRCDENVTRGMDDAGKRSYAAVLVQSAARRAMPGLAVVATGMSMTGKKLKMRVGAILRSGQRILALSLAFMITASLLLVCAFATADPNAPEPHEPEYDYYANAQRLDHAVYAVAPQAPRPVSDAEAALERVLDVFKGTYMQADVTGGSWKVEELNYFMDDQPVRAFSVTGVVNGEDYMAYVMAESGALTYIVAPYPDAWEWADDFSQRRVISQIPHFDDLAAYALEAAEAMEPGLISRMEGMYFLWDDAAMDESEARVVFFLFRVEGETDRELALEYTPVLKVWSFGQSNG